MIEGLFVITSVFIAYVVYQIVNEPKTTTTSESPQVQPEVQAVVETPSQPEVSPVVQEEAAPAAQVEAATPVAEVAAPVEEAPVAEVAAPVEEAPAAPKESTEPASEAAAKLGLKNPKTGEVVLVYNNYRFAKRWVKESLVSEGLLPKIYKNNELNADVEAKIKAAIAKLEAIDKYRP